MTMFNPDKLYVQLRIGVSYNGPIIPRRYTLTHSDETAELFLVIGPQFAFDKVAKMRDEVLAEWVKALDNYLFHVYLHVDDDTNPSLTPLRNKIFRRELPLALEAIRYGDRELFNKYKTLNHSNIIVHFISNQPQYNKLENWGTFSDYTIY